MKRVAGIGLIAAALGVVTAPVRADDGYLDRARVVSVTPVYETVEVVIPRRECWTERVVRRPAVSHRAGGDETLLPTLVGGALGGYLGHKLGDGRSEAVTTAMGTAIGLAVGHQLSHRRYRHEHHAPARVIHERRCRTVEHVETERRRTGYRVQYRYKGRLFETITDHHPGKWIRVTVDVEPVDDYTVEDF